MKKIQHKKINLFLFSSFMTLAGAGAGAGLMIWSRCRPKMDRLRNTEYHQTFQTLFSWPLSTILLPNSFIIAQQKPEH